MENEGIEEIKDLVGNHEESYRKKYEGIENKWVVVVCSEAI